MKKNNLIFVFILSILIFFTYSCDNKNEEIEYSVEVIDIDGEKIFEDNIINKGGSLLDDLKEVTIVDGFETEYGFYLESIANSIVDNNYFIAIYENDKLASTGIDGIIIDDGDSFKFQVECFNTLESGYGTFDDLDILVDKIIYSYAKNELKEYLNNMDDYTQNNFSTADFWSFIGLNLMVLNSYDDKIFNYKNVSSNLKNDLESYDLSKLEGAQFAKYYFASKGLGIDLNNFKEFYQKYINELEDVYLDYSEYEYSFTLGISKYLDVTSTKLENIISSSYRASTEYGIDGLAWQIASLAQFNDLNKNELAPFIAKDYGNAVSQALAILPYVALGENPRKAEYKNDSNKDIIEILIENYYDSNLGIIKYNSTKNSKDNFTPQIYASLMAYKVLRDYGDKVYIFS